LESIEEEKKVTDSIYSNKANQKFDEKASINQRYRKSLVFNEKDFDKEEQHQLEKEIDTKDDETSLPQKVGDVYRKSEKTAEEMKSQCNPENLVSKELTIKKCFDKNEKTSNMFSKETGLTGMDFFNSNQNFTEDQKDVQAFNNIEDLEDEDDFLFSNRKKDKKKNNLLQLLSNDDLTNMQQHIMRDFNKNKSKPIEEEKEQLESVGEEEIEEINFGTGGVPALGNIFYPIDKEAKQTRY
jgi:hypothetical protein